MVSDEFVQKQSERLFTYFQAKNLTIGLVHYPSVDKIKVLVKELCEIAEVEGNASDAYIQVFRNDDDLVVRPVVIIKRQKEEKQ